MKKIITDIQLEKIKAFIVEELRVRCIFAPLTVELSKNRSKEDVISVMSEPFNTVPVIHSEIRIDNFGGSVKRRDKGLVEAYIPVHASYKGNGVGLFDVVATMVDGDESKYCSIEFTVKRNNH